jgi:DNA-binding SARP family transcriptional activator
MERREDSKDVLIVGTLGGFTMSWNGNPVGAGIKARDSQFTRLMEILLHNRVKGVSRAQIEELVFEESNSDDLNHMFRSVMYNTRRRLAADGLPQSEYIIYRKGRYYWTPDIPVVEDARVFEELSARAESEPDPAIKTELFCEAVRKYNGPFLPFQKNIEWVIRESSRYRSMFTACMEKAIDLLRLSGDYDTMEELGRHATEVDPLSEWEFITIEALVETERYEEARIFYEETVDLYMNELGIRPTADAVDMLDRLGGKLDYRFALIDEIQADLTANNDREMGGYYCTYPIFRSIYRFVERMLDRSGQSVYLMLCTIIDGSGKAMSDGAVLSRLSERLRKAIIDSVRQSDVLCRYGKGQFLVLLLNTNAENCEIIEKRIEDRFYSEGQRTGVSFHVSEIAYKRV